MKLNKTKQLPNGVQISTAICGATGKEYTNADGFRAMLGISLRKYYHLKQKNLLPISQTGQEMFQQPRFFLEDVVRMVNFTRKVKS